VMEKVLSALRRAPRSTLTPGLRRSSSRTYIAIGKFLHGRQQEARARVVSAYWDAAIGHSQRAIDALRDAPELARYNPELTIVTIDLPRTSILFRCVSGARYLNLHTREFG